MKLRWRTALALAAVAAASAASARIELVRATVGAGGGRATGGPYAVTVSIGQADAHRSMSSPHYQLAGGFWPDQRADALFGDGFEAP